MIEIYPNIRKALFLITVDNGGLNRDRSEGKVISDMDAWIIELSGQHSWFFSEIDAFIGALTPEDLDTLCCGEETEMGAVQARGPESVGELLNAWFEGPC